MMSSRHREAVAISNEISLSEKCCSLGRTLMEHHVVCDGVGVGVAIHCASNAAARCANPALALPGVLRLASIAGSQVSTRASKRVTSPKDSAISLPLRRWLAWG
jgi:hypothetical protein